MSRKWTAAAAAAAAAAELLQSCPTPCDPIDGSPPGSPAPGFSRQEHWSGVPLPSSENELDYLIYPNILLFHLLNLLAGQVGEQHGCNKEEWF